MKIEKKVKENGNPTRLKNSVKQGKILTTINTQEVLTVIIRVL